MNLDLVGLQLHKLVGRRKLGEVGRTGKGTSHRGWLRGGRGYPGGPCPCPRELQSQEGSCRWCCVVGIQVASDGIHQAMAWYLPSSPLTLAEATSLLGGCDRYQVLPDRQVSKY
jgi:hypothetical protein